MNKTHKRLIGFTAAAAASFGAFGVTNVVAAPPVDQEGLVNVNLQDVAIQVPIALAANICDVNVAVLVGGFVDDAADCEALGGSTATVERDRGGNGRTTQNGLVNVNATNIDIQVPIGVAANICDVNVAVLVNTFLDDAADCNADADVDAVVSSLP